MSKQFQDVHETFANSTITPCSYLNKAKCISSSNRCVWNGKRGHCQKNVTHMGSGKVKVTRADSHTNPARSSRMQVYMDALSNENTERAKWERLHEQEQAQFQRWLDSVSKLKMAKKSLVQNTNV